MLHVLRTQHSGAATGVLTTTAAAFDRALLDALPAGVDPCGEVVTRDGCVFVDMALAAPAAPGVA